MFRNITNDLLSFIFNYFYDNQEYHDLKLPLKLSDFENINNAITINKTKDSICIETHEGSYFLDYSNLEHFPKKIYDYLVNNNHIEGVKMTFKDAPVGARFRYQNRNEIWIKINSYPKGVFYDGTGLIARWNGNVKGFQNFCSFCDEEHNITFYTIIELV